MDKERYLNLIEKYIANKATKEEVQDLFIHLEKGSLLNDWLEKQITNSPSEINNELKQKMFNQIQEGISLGEIRKTNRSSWNRLMRIAASIILPLLIAYGGFQYYSMYRNAKKEPLIVSAGYGEKANIILPDGSRVWLNSGSKLTYHDSYNESKRKLNLDGEAFFEVVHDANKEFVVECMGMEVTVLGTSFNVKAYDEDSVISTVLLEGKIKIETSSQSLVLNPRERLIYNKSKKTITAEVVDPTLFVGWRQNRLRFENESLQDIAKTIARIHNIDYSFSDETIKNIRFTGTVDNTSIGSVLNSIMLTSPISYSIEDSTIVFSKDLRKKRYFEN